MEHEQHMRETTAYIGLGSNLGDRFRYLTAAIMQLHALGGVRVTRCSSVYETAPVGLKEQPPFLNMAIEVATSLPPLDLLEAMLAVERSLGRVRTVRWGPRTIDLDLLVYGDVRMRTERLELPHPRMLERAFVLVPLLELCDGRGLAGGDAAGEPRDMRPAAARKERDAWRRALDTAEGKEDVRLWKTITWRSESGRFEN